MGQQGRQMKIECLFFCKYLLLILRRGKDLKMFELKIFVYCQELLFFNLQDIFLQCIKTSNSKCEKLKLVFDPFAILYALRSRLYIYFPYL
jgi:hypothetical protein